MGKRLYINHLAPSVDSSALEDIFTIVGNVQSASVVIDIATGLSKGCGYVEMSTEQEAADCIQKFHGQMAEGSVISVVEDKSTVKI